MGELVWRGLFFLPMQTPHLPPSANRSILCAILTPYTCVCVCIVCSFANVSRWHLVLSSNNWRWGVPQAVDSNATGTPSHNHHFMGAFGAFMWESLLGLHQGERTAYEHFVVAPAITNAPELSSAKATTLTPRGNITVEWIRQHDESLTINVIVPPNAMATVRAPLSRGAARMLRESGVALLPTPETTAAFTFQQSGIRSVRRLVNGQFEIIVGSGSFTFQV
eukprot:m.309253 g.309253  ORF g.309253 m.309253 type:complete len:222 (+) comp27424_c0_seq5:2986-3651(+)